jgi:hypothetical protein
MGPIGCGLGQDQMYPFPILRSINRLKPGRMLDIGARNCTDARFFAEVGYTVDAIDPDPAPENLPQSIVYHQTTLEDYTNDKPYDLVLASRVSHMVDYDVRTFIGRLKTLIVEDGLIYVTLFGDEDDWADKPWSNTVTFDEACSTMAAAGLTPIYRSVEWFHGQGYSRIFKFWHIYTFVLKSA